MTDLINECNTKDSWSVFDKKTNVPEYDDPKKYNRFDIYTSIEFMSPREYINKIIDGVERMSMNEDISRKDLFTHYTVDRVNHTSIQKIREQLSSGNKMWLPYLRYQRAAGNNITYIGQEGIHRALVAYQLGIKKIPVMKIVENQ